MHKIISIISLTSVLSPIVLHAQIEVTPSDKNLPMVIKDAKDRPKLNINVSKNGAYTIDKVAFTIKQLAVVFKNIHQISPKIIVHLTTEKDVAQDHVINLLNASTKAGISTVTFTELTKKNGEQVEVANPYGAFLAKFKLNYNH